MRPWFLMISLLTLFSCRPAPEIQAEKPPVVEERVLIHPDFDITLKELETQLSGLSEKIKGNILQRPQVFLELMNKAIDLPEDALVLVDKNNALTEEDAPAVLAELDRYPQLARNSGGLLLNQWVLPPLLAMSEAARQEGVTLLVSSTYRPYARQKRIYFGLVDSMGQEEADRVSAYPGKSQHQLGNTVDFGSITEAYEETEAGQWLLRHGGEYGWSLSYPKGMEEVTGYKYEVWHYRYITPLGTEIQKEFFEDVQQYFLEFWHQNNAFFRSKLHKSQ